MKRKSLSFSFIFLLGLFFSLSLFSQELCIEQTKKIFFNEYGMNLEQARDNAIRYCFRGGKLDCLAPTEKWFFNQTRASLEVSRKEAVIFCEFGGKPTCLSPAVEWFFNHIPNIRYEKAIEVAVNFCRFRGDISCIERWQPWFFENTKDDLEQSFYSAMKSCQI